MDTAAPPTLLFRRRSTLDRLRLDPALEIGAGGEAVVYGLPGDDSLVAKLYHDPGIDRARKLAAMVTHPPAMPAGTAIAWPADVLLAERGGFAGFLMPRAEGPRVFEFYNPVSRRATAPRFHAGLLHRAGRNLAAAFHALHAAGYVVGDVNESNLLVHPGDAAVTLVDADSLQVRDGEGVFRSRVGKPEFTPPELLGVDFGQVDRTPAHDRFGLAVLLYLLLMEGTHPFAARMEATAEAVPVEERIRAGLFPHASPDDDCRPPRLSPPFEALHPPLRELFLRAFVAGHADPAARPSCEEWRDALEAAEAVLEVCSANPLHRFAPHLYSCPWCSRRALLGGRDPFPRDADAAPRPRPQRARAPSAAPAAGAHAPPPGAAPVVTPYGTRVTFAPPPGVPAPGQAVGPMGMMRRSGPPAPDVFGSSGLLNPLVIVGPAAILTFTGGTLGFISMMVAFAAVIALISFAWKNVRAATVALAIAATVFTATLASLAYAAATVPTPPPAQLTTPAAAPEAGATGALAALADPLSVRNVDDFMVGELASTPIREHDFASGGAAAPARPDDPSVDVRLLDRWPRLRNQHEAARALAGAYAAFAPDFARPDTAMIWLRVETDGSVAQRQVIRASTPEMEDAARVAAGDLRFEPGAKDGVAHAAWVVMRFVIVP